MKTKRSMNLARAFAVAQGQRIARKVFEKRSRGKGQRNVEAHLSELELAAMLAVAVELGLSATVAKPLVRELLEFFCAECLCHEWTTDGGKPGRCVRCRAKDFLGEPATKVMP